MVQGDLPGDAGHDFADVPGFAFEAVAEDVGGDAGSLGNAGCSFESHLRGGDQVYFAAGEMGVIGFDRFAASAFQYVLEVCREADAVAAQDAKGVFAGSGIADSGAGGDVAGVVAGDVGNEQGDDSGGVAGCSQPSAFDRGEVPPDAVHFADAGAGFQEFAVERLFVFEADTVERQGQQGGAAAGDEAEDGVVGAEGADEGFDAPGGFKPGGIGKAE